MTEAVVGGGASVGGSHLPQVTGQVWATEGTEQRLVRFEHFSLASTHLPERGLMKIEGVKIQTIY